MNKYELASIATTSGIDDNENHKLAAKQQRDLFGYIAIGRKDIRFDPSNQGTVIIGQTVTTDYVTRSYTYEEFAQIINDRKQVEAW